MRQVKGFAMSTNSSGGRSDEAPDDDESLLSSDYTQFPLTISNQRLKQYCRNSLQRYTFITIIRILQPCNRRSSI